MKPNIELHIDELIINGLSKNKGRYVGHIVRRELRSLLVNGNPAGITKQSSEINHVSINNPEIKRSGSPERIGRELAHNLYSSLNQKSTSK